MSILERIIIKGARAKTTPVTKAHAARTLEAGPKKDLKVKKEGIVHKASILIRFTISLLCSR